MPSDSIRPLYCPLSDIAKDCCIGNIDVWIVTKYLVVMTHMNAMALWPTLCSEHALYCCNLTIHSSVEAVER